MKNSQEETEKKVKTTKKGLNERFIENVKIILNNHEKRISRLEKEIKK